MWKYNYYDTFLAHHGILGMKWGVRRSLKQLGYKTDSHSSKPEGFVAKPVEGGSAKSASGSKAGGKASKKKKSVSDMTDDELNSAINRMSLEKRYTDAYNSMHPTKESPVKAKAGKLVDGLADAGIKAVTGAVADVGQKWVNKQLTEAFGLNDTQKSAYDKYMETAKKEYDKLKLENDIKQQKETAANYAYKNSEEGQRAAREKQAADFIKNRSAMATNMNNFEKQSEEIRKRYQQDVESGKYIGYR